MEFLFAILFKQSVGEDLQCMNVAAEAAGCGILRIIWDGEKFLQHI